MIYLNIVQGASPSELKTNGDYRVERSVVFALTLGFNQCIYFEIIHLSMLCLIGGTSG